MRDNPVAAASQGVDVKRLRFLIYVAAAVGTGMVGAVYFMSAAAHLARRRLRCELDLDRDLHRDGRRHRLDRGAADRRADVLRGRPPVLRYGATYMVVLGLMTLCMALFARTGLWGLWTRRIDAPWFPVRRRLVKRTPP